jgi:ADP-ribose pyrophosphatase YjhB (NUDIX family)
MAYVGLGNYVVVVMPVGGSKASEIKLVLQREPRSGETWFLVGSILRNDEHVDAAVRDLLEETGHTLTQEDFTLLGNNPVQVSLPEGKQKLVYVFSASFPVAFMATNIRTRANN